MHGKREPPRAAGSRGLGDSGTLGLMWRQCPDFIIALAGLTGSGGRFATP